MILLAGTTSFIKHVFIMDSTSTTGAGKTALAYGDITAYYVRAGGALTALTLVDITTLGTWDTDVTSDKLGFKKLDDTNAPGIYEIHLPDNILAAGATGVTLQLRATGAAPCNLEIELVSATRGLAGTALPAAAADAAGGLVISDAGGFDIDALATGVNVTTIEGVDATDALAASTIAVEDILDEAVEGTVTVRQILAVILDAITSSVTGAGTDSPIYKNRAGAVDRVAHTITDEHGNRDAAVLSFTDL